MGHKRPEPPPGDAVPVDDNHPVSPGPPANQQRTPEAIASIARMEESAIALKIKEREESIEQMRVRARQIQASVDHLKSCQKYWLEIIKISDEQKAKTDDRED